MEEVNSTVLIVDDEDAIRSILHRKLKLDGYYCDVAADGQEALYKASKQSFDLVLLDINMPGISGMEVLRRLTADYPDTCVIMVTAIQDAKVYLEALRLGAYDYVTKPFDLDDVSARVKRALEIRRLVLKKGGRQLSPEQNEAIRSLICGEISLEEFNGMDWKQDGESTSGDQFAIPTFGSVHHPIEMVRYMQMLRELLLLGATFRASIGGDGEWAKLPGGEITDRFGDYADLIEIINRLNTATTLGVSGRLRIPDCSLIESIPLAQGEHDGSNRLASPYIIMPQLERLTDTMLIARIPHKRHREAGYLNNTAYRHPYPVHFSNEEAVEAFVNLSREQCNYCTMDSFLQILGRQAMISQFPTLVGI
jgi:DNA-binding response OmpR family regulator